MFEIKPKKFKESSLGLMTHRTPAAFSYAVDKAKRDGSEIGIVPILRWARQLPNLEIRTMFTVVYELQADQ